MPSKYIASRVATLKPSGIRKFFDIAASMPEVISLGIGEPDFVTPKPILDAGIASLQAGHTGYTSNAGLLELRQAISEHLQEMYGVKYDPASEVMISVGVSEALYLALTALLNLGEEVIVPTPCFVSYQAEVILAGGVPVEIPSRLEDNFQPDVQAIADAVNENTRAILIGYPNNPTGAVASRKILAEIGKIAQQHDLVVISDEIYDQLVYGVEHICFPSLPEMHERAILLGGFSKDYAMTGWRVGFAAAPKEILQGLLRIHQYTVMCAPTTSQMAALKALQVGAPFVAEMQAEYDRRRRLIVDAFNEFGMPTFEPRGAFYAFPQITSLGMDDEQFAMELLTEEKVAVVPGSAFGPGGEGFIRCSYATAYEQIEQALERVARFIGKHR